MSHTTLFAPISSLAPLCLTSSLCTPYRPAQVQLSSGFLGRHRLSFASTWQLGLLFCSCFSLKTGKTLPTEGKGILVGQVLVRNNFADNITCQWEDNGKTDQHMTSGPSLMYLMEKLPSRRNTQDIFKHGGGQFDKPSPFCNIQCWSCPAERIPWPQWKLLLRQPWLSPNFWGLILAIKE